MENQTLGRTSGQTLTEYVEAWLPTADLMPITKKGYESVFRNHIEPLMGKKKVEAVSKRSIREMIDNLKAQGISNSTIAQCKACLGSAFKPLVEIEQVAVNPTHGITLRRSHSDLRDVLEADEFKLIKAHLPSDGSRLFAQFLVMSGCRFGEASEIRVKDFNFKSGEVYVQRRSSELGAKANHGSRFLVVDATKSGHKRSICLSKSLMDEIKGYVQAHSLTKADLLFPKHLVESAGKLDAPTIPVRQFRDGGRTFQHGSLYAYTTGKCRCGSCVVSMREYRRKSRTPRVSTNSSGHLSRDLWRSIWNQAIAQSGIDWSPRTHDLRHANATALLKNGVDVHEVKERLGHQSIKTTERYLHRLRHQQSLASEGVNDFLE